MSRAPLLTFADRAVRHQRIAATYQAGHSSRSVAAMFGMNDSHVRAIARLYGIARPVGRPRKA